MTRRRWSQTVVAPLLAPLAEAAQKPAPPVEGHDDTIYHNGKIVTVWDARPVAQAMAIKDNRFLSVGSNDEVLRNAGPSTRKIDLHGRCVVPGLIESHVHPVSSALTELHGPVPVMDSIATI